MFNIDPSLIMARHLFPLKLIDLCWFKSGFKWRTTVL